MDHEELMSVLGCYTRVILDDVCSTMHIKDPTLSVWIRNGDEWEELSNRTVARMWKKSGSRSFCQIMLREFFGLNLLQYQLIKRKFKDPGELSGIYAKDNFTNFIIVVDIPNLLSTSNLLAGVGATTMIGAGLYGTKKALDINDTNKRLNYQLQDSVPKNADSKPRWESGDLENLDQSPESPDTFWGI